MSPGEQSVYRSVSVNALIFSIFINFVFTKDSTSGSNVLLVSVCLFHAPEKMSSHLTVKLIMVHGHNLSWFRNGFV